MPFLLSTIIKPTRLALRRQRSQDPGALQNGTQTKSEIGIIAKVI